MLLPMSSAVRHDASALRHRRDVRPIHFPGEEREDEKVPERPIHLWMRTALWLILDHAFGHVHATGSEQFFYFNARDPRRCCAPDVWLKLDGRTLSNEVWKTWERGAPEVVVEITSKSDRERWTWEEKLERFHEMGAREVVRFDPEALPGERLRIWDRIDDDLVERVVEGDASPCVVLGLFWVVAPIGEIPEPGPKLRLARDVEGQNLLPTPIEAANLAAETAQRDAQSAQREAESAQREAAAARIARETAERRVAELEAQLASRPPGPSSPRGGRRPR